MTAQLTSLGLLYRLGNSGLRAAQGSLQAGDPPPPATPLIVRSHRPIDLETPVAAFDRFLTANDDFFIRSHIGEPAIGLSPWSLSLKGLVEKPLLLSLEDLRGLEKVSLTAVLQCAGNGRSFFKPIMPGVPWDKGAVGNAEWTGVRLADVLKQASLGIAAAHVHFLGADAPPSPKTPAYLRSLPIAKAMEPSTILATAMNGVPIPALHGGPLRLIVPGWTGNHWMKWVREITVSESEAEGFYNKTAYKITKTPVGPEATPKPEDLVPLTFMNVKSLITAPLHASKIKRGPLEVRGVAWTGDGVVEKVEISTNADPAWRPAKMIDDAQPGTWRRWSLMLESNSSELTIRSRATDSKGEVQPETTPWNKSGYLWNAIDSVTLQIG